MKLLKNISLSLFIAVSTAGISSIAVAGAAEVAVDNVSAKVAEASQAIEGGSTQEEVMDLIRTAADLVKEVEVSDTLDVRRQRANGHLKKARLASKSGDLNAAKEHLAQAAKDFADLRKLM
ncbi:MAG: hypothetical protein Q7U18_05550 [Methylobacter sp.]|nr:hypothetical protein [Methylobacter sp.]